MKKISLLAFIFTCAVSFGQIQKIHEFSKGKFIDQKIIHEENFNDVYGYLLLFEIDRKSREIYELEYVVLDKNLNKLTSGNFIQGIFKTIFIKTEPKITYTKIIGGKLIFGLHDDVDNPYTVFMAGIADHFNTRYRILDLETFALSEEIVFEESKPVQIKREEGERIGAFDMSLNQTIYPVKGPLYFIFETPSKKPKKVYSTRLDLEYINRAESVHSFSLMDQHFTPLWKTKINQDKKNKWVYSYRDADENMLLLEKKKYTKGFPTTNIRELYDVQTGKFLGSFDPAKDDHYNMFNEKIRFSPGQVHFYNTIYDKKDKALKANANWGFSRITHDTKTGKEIKRDYMLWDDFKQFLPDIKKNGVFEKSKRIYFLEFIPLKNGNTIAFAEGFTTKSLSNILDAYMILFDANMKPIYFHKMPKKHNKTKFQGYGNKLYKEGQFDYYYSQKLDDEDNYVFFYANNEKENGAFKKKGPGKWVLGIITYADGEFEYNTLDLTTKEGMIFPYKAKNGYLLLQEFSNNNEVEIRLEKIDY